MGGGTKVAWLGCIFCASTAIQAERDVVKYLPQPIVVQSLVVNIYSSDILFCKLFKGVKCAHMLKTRSSVLDVVSLRTW